MKRFFVAILTAILTVPSFAQFSSGGFDLSKENLYYGVRIGMTSATLTGDDLDADSKVGMTLAGIIGLRVSDSTPLFLESGLYYTERGAKNVGYNNLEIPLLIKYGFKAGDQIALLPFIGPYFAQAISGKTKINGVKVGTFDEKKWMGLNRFNMGFKLGCGAEYNKLYLELGYQFGVNNISKADEIDGIHSNAFFANFGVNF
ncbi:MAG: outer membrane beta-barrel protein [Prevotella sp.]|nr:outer membrane beta-barrel protein [Prevotella sp.]